MRGNAQQMDMDASPTSSRGHAKRRVADSDSDEGENVKRPRRRKDDVPVGRPASVRTKQRRPRARRDDDEEEEEEEEDRRSGVADMAIDADPRERDDVLGRDSEESSDDDDEDNVINTDRPQLNVSRNNPTTMSQVFQAIHGDDDEVEELDQSMEKFTPTDWHNLAQSLLNTHLDAECSDRELLITFKLFYKVFCHPMKDDYAVLDRVKAIYPHVATMKDQFFKIRRVFGVLHLQLKQRDKLDESRVGREMNHMLTRISFGMKMTFEQMVTTRLLQKGLDDSMRAMLHDMSPLTFFSEIDTNKLKKVQQLVHFYYQLAYKHQYRKDKECLYRPRYNEHDEFVFSYEYVYDMSDFVFQGLHPIEQNHFWFECLTEARGNAKHCIDMLTNIKSEWLPDLERNPDIHAFKNGLFVLSLNDFFFFKKSGDRNWVAQLSGNLTAIKYHDIEFEYDAMEAEMNAHDKRHYMTIKMDAVHTVLAHQGFTMDERRWIFCFLGRMLHKVNEYDNWSVFVYFLGLAGTGKSTLLRLVASLLEARDIGYLNNSGQKTFSLDGLQDKLMYLALDIDENFTLDQVTWQSMVSGEEVSVTRKFKQPLTVIWKSHGGFAGNKLPGWTDNAGSLSRRLVVIEFLTPVSRSDPNLYENCLRAKDRFLKVINSAYMELAVLYKNRGIKEMMPSKFKMSEQKALVELNCLVAFIQECAELDPDPVDRTFFAPMKDFQDCFKAYCRRNSIKHKALVYNFYTGVFSKYQLKLINPTGVAPPADPAVAVVGTDAAELEKATRKAALLSQTEPYVLGLRMKNSAMERSKE
jgi:hypothetical protein